MCRMRRNARPRFVIYHQSYEMNRFERIYEVCHLCIFGTSPFFLPRTKVQLR